MAKRPYADSRLAEFVTKRVSHLRPKKKQIDIAAEAGFVNPNMVAMIKNGASKLPLDRVPALADALDCDPRYLFQLALEQVAGSSSRKAVEEIFGTVVSRREVVWLEEIRDASDGTDPVLTARMRVSLRAIFGK